MAEHDYNIANQSFPATRSDINNALAAIVSNNSKATAPTTTFAYMWWYDTTANILKQRNTANSGWIDIGYFDQTNGKFVARIHETLSKAAAYTTVAADRNKTILANANSAAFTIALLPAATAGNGFVQTFKKTDATANIVTIDGSGSEVIDDALTITLSAQYDSVTLISDGTKWHKVSPAISSASTTVTGITRLATNAEQQAGALNTVATTPAASKASLGVSSYYASPQQAITAGGPLTLNHGLTGEPMELQVKLKCVTAGDGNFSVGDTIFVNSSLNANGAIAAGISTRVTLTQLLARYGSDANTFRVIDPTSGNSITLTNSRWTAQFILRG